MVSMPSDSQRLAVIGRTGSGKTIAALWHLAHRSFKSKPWIIFDFKGDSAIAAIPKLREIDVKQKPPKNPGLYVVRPLPTDDDMDLMIEFMWGIWSNENTGVYVDEGYMVGRNNPAFRALLTQGRSKSVPMIMLSQRPVWLDRFVWSEADYFQVFHLNNLQDKKVIREFVPIDPKLTLPQYHSHYFDVGRNHLVSLKPVPDRDTILETFEERQRTRRAIM